MEAAGIESLHAQGRWKTSYDRIRQKLTYFHHVFELMEKTLVCKSDNDGQICEVGAMPDVEFGRQIADRSVRQIKRSVFLSLGLSFIDCSVYRLQTPGPGSKAPSVLEGRPI